MQAKYSGNKVCSKCKGTKVPQYNEKYDAFYCCDEWLEEACSDADCLFCNNRPKTPGEI